MCAGRAAGMDSAGEASWVKDLLQSGLWSFLSCRLLILFDLQSTFNSGRLQKAKPDLHFVRQNNIYTIIFKYALRFSRIWIKFYVRIKFQQSSRPSVLVSLTRLKSIPFGHSSARILNRDIITVYTSKVLDSESWRFLGQQILTLESPVVTICTTCFNIKEFTILLTECIYGFHMILRINRDYFRNSINQLAFVMDVPFFVM